MSLHAPARWVVTYDIREPQRGVRVHRFLKRHGIPLQYSVFTVPASAAELHQLIKQLEGLIDPNEDDLRAYRWPEQAEVHLLGSSLLPDDLLLPSALPAPAAAPRRRMRVA